MCTAKHWCMMTLVLGVSMLLVTVVESAPMPSDSNAYYSDKLVDQPEEVLVDIIHQLEQQLIRDRTHDLMENQKRTVDFGLARGFSGIQEAKHRMGLAAANFAGGPGRKRRSANSMAV